MVIGKFIVDFYCHQAKLIIEIDGGQHFSDKQLRQDTERTSWFEDKGFVVLRFTNREVDYQFFQVCERIKEVADQRLVELSGK